MATRQAGPRILFNEFKDLRKSYQATKYPIVLCHGLLGLDDMRLFGDKLKYSYWCGLREILEEHGAEVLSPHVPPVATIEERAQILYELVVKEKKHKKVNLIGHSMGGLDGRYLISKVHPQKLEILSLTTVATPHRGSTLADRYLSLSSRLPTKLGAFAQLSTSYMKDHFNKTVHDNPDVAYFSYGARFTPTWSSILRLPWGIMKRAEGDNDGVVSVESAIWGEYQGTLENCDHLDVINMSAYKPLHLQNTNFKAAAMYLHVMDELASKGF